MVLKGLLAVRLPKALPVGCTCISRPRGTLDVQVGITRRNSSSEKNSGAVRITSTRRCTQNASRDLSREVSQKKVTSVDPIQDDWHPRK